MKTRFGRTHFIVLMTLRCMWKNSDDHSMKVIKQFSNGLHYYCPELVDTNKSFNDLFPTPIQEALHVPKHITYFVQLENKLTPTCDFLNLIPSSLYENAKILVGPV